MVFEYSLLSLVCVFESGFVGSIDGGEEELLLEVGIESGPKGIGLFVLVFGLEVNVLRESSGQVDKGVEGAKSSDPLVVPVELDVCLLDQLYPKLLWVTA